MEFGCIHFVLVKRVVQSNGVVCSRQAGAEVKISNFS